MNIGAETDSQEPLFERIAEEIIARQRNGERPTVEEYCARYPESEQELRTFLPALLAVEKLKPSPELKQDAPATSRATDTDKAKHSTADQDYPEIGEYHVLHEIGRGGMGVVYEAEQPSLGRRVALKVLPKNTRGDERAVRRFEREARAAASMHHTNIVPVFEVGCDDQHLFYTMQLIRGQSLDVVIQELKRIRLANEQSTLDSREAGSTLVLTSESANNVQSLGNELTVCSAASQSGDAASPFADQHVKSGGSTGSAVLPGRIDMSSTTHKNRQAYYRSVAQVGHQTAGALCYAHERGIIHRDIKPSNLILDGNGIVWITDFGLAKTTGANLTQTDDVIGTLRYMSPERFKGKRDATADIYSLGLTLYEMLALEPAFIAVDQLNLISKICKSTPLPLRTYDSHVSHDLETIILKSVSKDPRTRYQTAEEMADDLQRFIQDRPIRARRVSPAERLVRWSRQNKSLAAALFSCAALLIAVTIVSLVFTGIYRNSEEKATEAAFAAGVAKIQADRERDLATTESKRANENARKKSEYLYVAHMQMADHAWRAGAVKQTREILNRQLENDGFDLRDPAWFFLDALCRNIEAAPILPYDDIVVEIDVDPLGRFLAASGNDGNVKIFGLEHYDLIQTLESENAKIVEMTFSPDGKTLIGQDGSRTFVWKYDGMRFRQWGRFPGVSPIEFPLSPDGNKLVLLPRDHKNQVWWWDLTASHATRQHLSVSKDLLYGCWRRDSQRFVATFGDGSVGEFRLTDGKYGEIANLPTPAKYVDISKDDRFLILANQEMLQIRNLEDAADVRNLGMPLPGMWFVNSLATGFLVATRSEVSIWDYDGTLRRQIPLSPDFQLSLERAGRYLAMHSTDHIVTVFDDTTDEQTSLIGNDNTVYTVDWSADGQIFSGGRSKLVQVLDLNQSHRASQVLDHGDAWLWAARFSPDGKTVATASSHPDIVLWDCNSGHELARFSEHTKGGHTLAFSPDGKLLVTGGEDSAIHVREVHTGRYIGACQGHQAQINTVEFTPNGQWLLSASNDGSLRIWEAATLQPFKSFQLPKGSVWAATFVGNHEVVFGGTDRRIHAWEFTEGDGPKVVLESGFDVTSLRTSNDQRTVACTTSDGRISLIHTGTKELLVSQMVHTSDAMHTAFTPNDRTLISAGSDGSVAFWALNVGEPTLRINAHQRHVHVIDLSPSGSHFVTGSWDGTAKIWSLPGASDGPINNSNVTRAARATEVVRTP